MRPDAIYGVAIDGADVIEVPADLATLFAAAHLRVTGRPAGAHLGGAVVVDRWPAAPGGADVHEVVARLAAAERPVVLAGPGVVREHAVEGLRALAAAGSLGVLNTWGAKGVFEWTSPHHLATAGLQALDFELGGLVGADLIVATGIDEAETLAEWRLAPVIEVAPVDLTAVADRWSRPRQEIAVPELRTELARVTQAGWTATAGPLPPTRITRAYREALGPDGLVAADPGIAGYWVARTFPTSGVGRAIVPAETGTAGFAVACAAVARLLDPRRPVLVALDGAGAPRPDQATTRALDPAGPTGLDPATARILETAASLGLAVGVEVWSADGDVLDADAHAARLQQLLAVGGVATLGTDPTQLVEMVEIAGPVVAWGGIRAPNVPGAPAVGEAG